MDARLNFEVDRGTGPQSATRTDEPHVRETEVVCLNPSSASWDSRPDTGMWLAGRHVATVPPAEYRIDGWLAERGTSVWFGAGSTGKTQLLLWMAAMIASRPGDRPRSDWLGGEVNGTGHVLILTAEDIREQVVMRIVDVLEHTMCQSPEARERTCARLHVMPFLSMTEAEFKHPNPSLFVQNKEREWEPTKVMEEVRRYVSEWNRTHPAADDRIVGVVMDSATSMAGFDSLDAQATTNFFFYLGRLCERLRIFWTIIGHTPKATTISRLTYRATAASRLRGVAMWTTAPRLVVEVRLVQDWHERKKPHVEAKDVRDWLERRVRRIEREDLLAVYVAKANLSGATKAKRILVRQRRGAFVDVTDMPDDVVDGGMLGAPKPAADAASPETPSTGAMATCEQRPGAVTGVTAEAVEAIEAEKDDAGRELVLEMVHAVYPPSGEPTQVSANRLKTVLREAHADDPRAAFVKSPYGGGRRPARRRAINWHLDRLVELGRLAKRVDRFFTRATGPD